MIEIIALNELRRDGRNLGAVFDCLANHPDLLASIPDIQRGVEALLVDLGKKHEAALAFLKDTHATAIADLLAEHANEKAQRETAIQAREAAWTAKAFTDAGALSAMQAELSAGNEFHAKALADQQEAALDALEVIRSERDALVVSLAEHQHISDEAVIEARRAVGLIGDCAKRLEDEDLTSAFIELCAVLRRAAQKPDERKALLIRSQITALEAQLPVNP